MKNTQNFLLVFALIIFVGLGCRSSATRSDSIQPSGNVKNFVSATAANTNSDISKDQAASAPDKANAKVISLNANLRKTANSNGQIIGSLPEGISVAVIKRRGAWFYVRTGGGQTGWLHGNTIRLDSNDAPSEFVSREPVKAVAPVLRNAVPDQQVINSSGASAKCADGSLSYSAHRRGTCSHHGGVAQWY